MKKILLLLLFLTLFLFKPTPSFAEVIHNFDFNIVAHKNGTMDVREVINYDFQNLYRHGIFRNIPLFAKVGNLYRIYKIENIKVLRDGKKEQASVSSDARQLSIKIGNPDQTITGNHIYEIDYLISNGIGSNFADHDEIYWNATGNDWEVTIEKAKATITSDFNAKQLDFICYEGAFGAKDKSCKIDANSASSFKTLYPGYGLSVVAVYPVGTFPKSMLSRNPPQTLSETFGNWLFSHYWIIYLILNILLPIALIYWYQKHKNKKRFGVPVVNFDIPKDESGKRLPPALSGTIDTARLERDDIVATIFDLAIRKYIKIEQDKKVRKLLPDITSQTITKLKEVDEKLEDFEITLMDRLFQDGSKVNIDDLRLDFYETFQDMETEVFSSLKKRGYYIKNPATQKGFLVILSFFSLFTLNIFLFAVLVFLSRKLNGRTSLGDEIDFKIDGLKLFLKAMDRNYKWQAENFYTVEQMIPYAMALGYIDNFMEALKILKPDYNPGWYRGGNFYTNYAIFSSVASSSFTTSAPSSSSGSGGGGFSGGGGGGGGGGSW